jgi:glutaconate CoA-transferase subunit A
MADVANMHKNFLLYLTRHSPKSLLMEVDQVSAARGLLRDEERRAAGYQPGTVRLVTNLAIFELNHDTRLLELVSVHPGVSLEQVAAATGFPLQLATSVSTTEPPSRRELEMLRQEVDPLGIRRLEFIPGKDRTSLLGELLDSEEAAIQEFLQGA